MLESYDGKSIDEILDESRNINKPKHGVDFYDEGYEDWIRGGFDEIDDFGNSTLTIVERKKAFEILKKYYTDLEEKDLDNKYLFDSDDILKILKDNGLEIKFEREY